MRLNPSARAAVGDGRRPVRLVGRGTASAVASLVAVAMLAAPAVEAMADPTPAANDTTLTAVNQDQYTLGLTASMNRTTDVRVGGSGAVDVGLDLDRGQGPEEKVDATVILHYEGHPKGYVKAMSASVRASRIPNQGHASGGSFTPSRFGWTTWQEGSYWLEATVARQGGMKADASTTPHDPSLSFALEPTAPAAPTRESEDVTVADGMQAHTTVTAGTGVGGYKLTLTDRVDAKGSALAVGNQRVTVNGRHSDDFALSWNPKASTMTAEYAGTGELPANATVTLEYDATVSQPAITGLVEGIASLTWNDGQPLDSGSSSFRQWKPSPDATWIGWDQSRNRWITATDPDHTGETGLSGARVLDGDRLAIAVNATTPTGTSDNLKALELTADWSAADYLFAPDTKEAKVIETDATDVTRPTIDDVLADGRGRDVTGRFTLDAKDNKLSAVMKRAWLSSTQGHQYTLIVPGRAAFANGKGVNQLLKDQNASQGQELDLCANDGQPFRVTGSQKVNSQTIRSQGAQVCAYVPPVAKRVLASRLMDGGRTDIDGKIVSPGDKLEYQLVSTPSLPRLAYPVESIEVSDAYDPTTVIDPSSIEVRDANGLLATGDYERQIDTTNHRLTIRLTGGHADQWQSGVHPRLEVTFTATVGSRKTKATEGIRNVWSLRINQATAVSNTVGNQTCDTAGACDPNADGFAGETAVSVDGKAMLLGDRFNYQAGLDADKLKDSAYRVWRLGLVFSYDAKHLTLDASNITVIDQTTGKDMTGRFNIQTDGKTGRVWAFLKTVDTTLTSGETIPGDPQPTDLDEYADSDEHDALKDPAIDQSLLGHDYTLVLPMSVTNADSTASVDATAVQVTDRMRVKSKPVTATIRPIMPGQDATVNVGGDSLNNSSVYQGSRFLYRMDSSVLPADRANATVTDWRLDAKYNPQHDEYTGQWAVYAATDLYDHGEKIASKGERIAGSDYANPDGELFTLTRSEGMLTITATQRFLDMASANTGKDQAWRAYAQFTRIQPGDAIGITVTETLNGQQRTAKSVTTRTPDQTPRLTVTKWDQTSGETDGDRDTTDQALGLEKDGTRIVFTIRNESGVDQNGRGAWFKASDIDLSDRLVAGDGVVADLEYPADWDTLVLKPGQSVQITGTLSGVRTHHTDRATVTGVPLVSCPTPTEPPFGDASGDGETDDAGTGTGAQAGTGLETVEVEGRTLCKDTAIRSDADDWNGYATSRLARTGTSNGLTAMIVAGLLLLAGLGILLAALHEQRRKTNQEATDDGQELVDDLEQVSDDGETTAGE